MEGALVSTMEAAPGEVEFGTVTETAPEEDEKLLEPG
jgi:hypothetical protein